MSGGKLAVEKTYKHYLSEHKGTPVKDRPVFKGVRDKKWKEGHDNTKKADTVLKIVEKKDGNKVHLVQTPMTKKDGTPGTRSRIVNKETAARLISADYKVVETKAKSKAKDHHKTSKTVAVSIKKDGKGIGDILKAGLQFASKSGLLDKGIDALGSLAKSGIKHYT